MRFTATLSVVVAMCSAVTNGQSSALSPAFEAASIKAAQDGGNYVEVTPGTVIVHSATAATCITWAYSVQRSQLVGANAAIARMLDSDRYDVVAKASSRAPEADLRQMLQGLRAERFNLTMHHERRDMQTYALVVDSGGPKFRESASEGDSVERPASKLTRAWERIRMAQFADQLSDAMQAPVSDETGLHSRYDLSLDLTPYLAGNRTGERPDIATMMVTAVKEQLGLRLVPRRASADVLVVDRLERASPN